MKFFTVGLLISLTMVMVFFKMHRAKVILPRVPDVLKPQVPSFIDIDLAALTQLSDTDHILETTPGLFKGDMAIDDRLYKHWRVGLLWNIFPERLWPNATIPFAISPLYDADDQITIYSAVRRLNFMTCVKFVPWNGRDKDFLLIWPIKYPRGCWSYIGRTGGAQIVSLTPPDSSGPNCLGEEGTTLHELMHALGIFHEQSRADRDLYVNVHWDNILSEFISNFEKQSLTNTTYSFEYDYNSIMHYGMDYFSKGKDQPTITAKMSGAKIGQRLALTKTDCLKINDLYKCLEKPKLRRKYYTLCKVLGI